ncbi:hypothetical protein I7I48_12233 [Histoplasma ohiense]|nr:hypothetical protein I7I48_12233 [Histoplasma ohiense (nom. inval.)]
MSTNSHPKCHGQQKSSTNGVIFFLSWNQGPGVSGLLQHRAVFVNRLCTASAIHPRAISCSAPKRRRGTATNHTPRITLFLFLAVLEKLTPSLGNT